jgi:hypothetical protein
MAKQRKPTSGNSRQEFAYNQMQSGLASSGLKPTGNMSKSMKRQYIKTGESIYNSAVQDYNASTKYDELKGISSRPQPGARYRALGSGMNLTTPKVTYDSKGNKIKGFSK